MNALEDLLWQESGYFHVYVEPQQLGRMQMIISDLIFY